MSPYRIHRPGEADTFTYYREDAREAELAGATVTPSALFTWRDAVSATLTLWGVMLGCAALGVVIKWVDAHCPPWVLVVVFLAAIGATPLWLWLLKGDRR